jgi:hypothetical protein
MRRFAFTAVAAVALAAALTVPSVAEGTMTFPSETGRDLNGRTLQLPRDFEGDADLVFVAFVRGQQADVDTWKAFADAARAKHPALRVYACRCSRGAIRGCADSSTGACGTRSRTKPAALQR